VVWFSAGVFPLRPLVIYSGSMRPAFDAGDIVLVAKREVEQLSEGDIIYYRSVDSPVPVVHRLIKINKDKTLIAKGDDNEEPDDAIKPEQVRGKVVLVIPKAGWASVYIREIIS
jgi:signal peptidase